MSAHVLLNLLNNSGKKNKMRGLQFFHQVLHCLFRQNYIIVEPVAP